MNSFVMKCFSYFILSIKFLFEYTHIKNLYDVIYNKYPSYERIQFHEFNDVLKDPSGYYSDDSADYSESESFFEFKYSDEEDEEEEEELKRAKPSKLNTNILLKKVTLYDLIDWYRYDINPYR